jgi:hypothetical protein
MTINQISDPRWQDVLRAYKYEPDPSMPNTGPGARKEGFAFQAALVELLAHPDFLVLTAQGKSSKGSKVDGSAVSLVSFKLLRAARTAEKPSVVLAMNNAFERYTSQYLEEIRLQARYLEAKSDISIWILTSQGDYARYVTHVLGWV